MKNRQRKLVTALLTIAVAIGLCLLLYPAVSNLWNSYHQSKVVVSYTETVSGMSEEEKEAMRQAARDYNWILNKRERLLGTMTDEELKEYNSLLDVTGTGIMGYIEIPEIDVSLAIYHGTSEAVLTSGAGHIEGSSLPVGGRSTHSVISGHRGLPSAMLFTDIDQLKEGSVFYLHILGEVLTYEVDQILTVEPHETGALKIEDGQDYCTLVTCTPYGINSHRLLVRGHRIETPEDAAEEEIPEIDRTFFAVIEALVAVLTAGGAAAVIYKRRRKRKRHTRKKRRVRRQNR